MKTITHQCRLRLVTLAFLVLGLLLLAQPDMARQGSEDYDVSILTPNAASRRDGAEIVVRVRTPQGEPAHGIPVRFQLDPAWQGAATLVPEQTTTDHGIARARLRAALIGNVRVTVWVGHGTVIRRTGIAFSLPGGGETGAD